MIKRRNNHALVSRRLSPSYKNQPVYLRDKAVEIANEIIKESGDEGLAIATGLKRARQYFKAHPEERPANSK